MGTPEGDASLVAKTITGIMRDVSLVDGVDFKGRIGIEWAGSRWKQGTNEVLPGCLTTVRDNDTGEILPCAGLTIHVPSQGLITADVAVYLDEHGEIIYDLAKIAESDAVPATFPFLVAGMRAL
jgi:hypothetical protein